MLTRSTFVPGHVTQFSLTVGGTTFADPAMSSNADLQQACDRARVVHRAMAALASSVAALSPEDLRHAAAHAAAELLRPEWLRQLGMASCLAPATNADWVAKSGLLASLVERDELDRVVGGPALQLAASLADDLLCAYGAGT